MDQPDITQSLATSTYKESDNRFALLSLPSSAALASQIHLCNIKNIESALIV